MSARRLYIRISLKYKRQEVVGKAPRTRTSVAFMSPARVWPTRNDNSSVANASNYLFTNIKTMCQPSSQRPTLARGMMARNETGDINGHQLA